MAQLYADENFDYPTVVELRALGHDVLTVQEAGNRGDSDDQVLAFATQTGRAVLTHDRRDFDRLHRRNSNHAGIISATLDDAAALATRIHATLTATGALLGKHLRVNLPP